MHYPQLDTIKRQADRCGHALTALAGMGIEAETIIFGGRHPIIEVKHCPGNKNLISASNGQGTVDGKRYMSKVADVKGCLVRWREFG